MFSNHSPVRIIPPISALDEWAYLTNETLEGERAIVPLLKEMIEKEDLPQSLIRSLEQQYDEEIAHVRGYYALVGKSSLRSTGFGVELKEYVRQLDSVALKLFSLQALLEGIALGALQHRLVYWKQSPSYKMDLQAHEDEERHVSLSHRLFRELIEAEGTCSEVDFRKVEKSVNSLFKKTFSGAAIAEWVAWNVSGVNVTSTEIENSLGIKSLRRRSAPIIAGVKSSFLNHYREALDDVAS